MSFSRSLSLRHKTGFYYHAITNANMNFFSKSFLSRAKEAPWKFHQIQVSTRGQGGCETSVRGESCKHRLYFPKSHSPACPGQRKECCSLYSNFPSEIILAVKSAASWSPKGFLFFALFCFVLFHFVLFCFAVPPQVFDLWKVHISLSGGGRREERKFSIENEGMWIGSGLGQCECQKRSEWNFRWRST